MYYEHMHKLGKALIISIRMRHALAHCKLQLYIVTHKIASTHNALHICKIKSETAQQMNIHRAKLNS